jgi:hypothetical protein
MQKHISKVATKISNSCTADEGLCYSSPVEGCHPMDHSRPRRRWSSVRVQWRISVGGTATGLLIGGRGRERHGGDPWGETAGSGMAGFHGGVVAKSDGSPLGQWRRGILVGDAARSSVREDPWGTAAGSGAAGLRG